MPDFNTYRFDENLLGRIMVAKIKALDGLTMETKLPMYIGTTVIPDKKFESFSDWKKYIHDQHALNERLKIEQYENRQKFEENISYYNTWLQTKFNTII